MTKINISQKAMQQVSSSFTNYEDLSSYFGTLMKIEYSGCWPVTPVPEYRDRTLELSDQPKQIEKLRIK